MSEKMTDARWQRMTISERDAYIRERDAYPKGKLADLIGWRVEIVTTYGTTERGIVGRSGGWQPCFILLKLRTSSGGWAAPSDQTIKSVRKLYRVR